MPWLTKYLSLLLPIFIAAGCKQESPPVEQTATSEPSRDPISLAARDIPSTFGDTLNDSLAQLGKKPEYLEIPGQPGTFHLIQRSRDGYLALTPNECFFPNLGLTAAGEGAVADIDQLNGGKSFDHVTGWDPGEVVEWGIWLAKPGALTIRVRMSSSSDAGRFELSLDDQKSSFALFKTRDGSAEIFHETAIPIRETGRHILRITNIDKPADDTKLHWVELSGPAIDHGAVLRKRWRPAAAHTRFTTSKSVSGVRMWIMEMDAVPGNLGFYAPITTPFGYYGPSWNADGTVKSGMNFSLWSYGRGQKEPPIGQLSHLLAIGNRDAKFSGFGHEGTGVKIREWEPLKGRQGQRQAFALRAEPGKDFNTYYSYFYATDETRWRLFGVGRQKPKRRPLTDLWVGSFVEVPGPPQRQRTGSGIRRMRYRGWVSADGDKWHRLDNMSLADVNKETGLTYTDRGLDDDGWFYMQTGGWIFRKAPTEAVSISGDLSKVPDYLKPKAIQPILTLPSSIRISEAQRTGNTINLEYEIIGIGDKPKVTAYHGDNEGLTLAEKWDSQTPLPTPREGRNSATFPAKGNTHVRLLLQHDEGQFWTAETTEVR